MEVENAHVPYDPFAGPSIIAVIPSTPAQLEIWTAMQMGGDAALAYNEAVRMRLGGPLDLRTLQLALESLIDRHESLRATFSRDGRSMLISERTPHAIAIHDHSARTATEQERALALVEAAVVSTPFDLEVGPLARFDLLRFAEQEHVLIIATHHLVCDGWSFGVIACELKKLYDAIARGESPSRAAGSLGATPLFSEYAAGTRAPGLAPDRANSGRYWQGQFAEIPAPLDLPGDRPRPAYKSYGAARVDTHLSTELLASLKRVAAQREVSLFAALFSGFAALLARLSGSDDIVVGVPAAGQLASDAPGLVGHCVNTLPLRIRVALDEPFDALLKRSGAVVLDGFDHQAVGYGQIVEQLALPRDAARVPLTSVMFNVDRALTPAALSFGGLSVRMESLARRAENFDLSLNATETDHGLALECHFNTDLFDASTVRRWMAAYERLLQSAVAAPETPVGRLQIRTTIDDEALRKCNSSARVWDDGVLAHQLIEAQVQRTPDAIAVEHESAAMTYRELNVRANRLAHVLRAEGVGRGTMVGLYLDRTPDVVVSLVAVLKAGGAYVPMDPALPMDRLLRMADDAALTAVITSEGLGPDASAMSTTVISLDGDRRALNAASEQNLPQDGLAATPSDPAYVIFTSGSTGRPKGVVLSQGSLVNLLLSVQETPGMESHDTVLAITTLSFDIAVSEVLLPLTVGARIVLASREVATDGALLRTLVESRGVTFIDATPATYRMLLAAGWTGGAHLKLICTGEALPKELADILPRCARELWNGYGPSETTVWSTFHRVLPNAGPVLIGRPVANTVVDIRDAFGQSVPVGVAGELFLGGAGVAIGYLGNPQLTLDRFRRDAVIPELRWYRTGDLARLLPSGDLECLGRADDQVKIRGYRIEPGEIAAVASQWPGVRQAVVVARADDARNLRLVAYVVADGGISLGDDFRAHLRRALPEYMMPTAFVRLAEIPLTASGKVDKKRLPAPDTSVSHRSSAFEAPRSATERMLAALWCDALGLGEVSLHDDFFALGGHSLLASQLLSRLRRDHRIELTFRSIFEAPTIAKLARLIDAGVDTAAHTTLRPAVTRRAGSTAAPLSAQQERLWMLEELEPARHMAHVHPASWELRGPLNADVLTQAFSVLARRHPMLRTSFHVIDGERTQVEHENATVELHRVDLSAHAELEQEAAMRELFSAAQATPFALDRAPLMRATLVALGADRHRLFTLQHGLIWDGWSFDLFLRDLSEAYSAILAQREAALPPLAVSFGDYAAWQQTWLAGPLARGHREWWDARLSDAPESIDLPVDRPRPLVSSYRGGQRSIAFDLEMVEALQRYAHRHDSTLFMVLLTAFGALLQRHTGQRQQLIAAPMRARMQAELEDVVGPFVNAIVLPQAISPETTFAQALAAVRETALDSYAHQELPFERLGRLPAIRVVFSMQDARTRPPRLGPIDVTQVHVPLQAATNDLTLWTVQFADRMQAVMNYNTDILDDATIELMLAQLQALLRALPDSEDLPIGELPLRTAFEQAPTSIPAVATADRGTKTCEHFISPIARMASESPDALALRDRNTRMSYAELWQRTSQLVAALAGRGVRPGDAVAIATRRASDRVVAVLGVLRAGGRAVVLTLEDGAEYRQTVIAGASPRLTIVDGAAIGADGAIGLTVLEQEGASVPSVEHDAGAMENAGVVLAEPDATLLARVFSVPLSRLVTQAGDLMSALRVGKGEHVLHAVPSSASAYIPSLLALLGGGALVELMDDDGVGDAEDLADVAADCSQLVGVAEAWRVTLARSWNGPAFRRGMIVGGGLREREIDALVARQAELIQVTGVTADAAITVVRRLDHASRLRWHAITGTAVRVADERGTEAPAGVQGRLQFARAGLDATWHDTGFVARRLPSGELRMRSLAESSRLHSQGQAANVSELEAILGVESAHAAVAVAAHEDAQGSMRLVAHVATPDQSPDVAALRAKWRVRLPFAFLPTRVVPERAFPRGADGTLRREQLLSPFAGARAHQDQKLDAPSSADEHAVSDVWKEMLDVPFVGRSDNFFRLGGTSLLCFRAIEAIRNRTSIRVSPRTFLTGTMADVASELTGKLRLVQR